MQKIPTRFRVDEDMLIAIKCVKGKNFSEKIRKTLNAGLNQKPIDNNNYSDLIKDMHELKREISAVGNNLNQLVFMLNSGYVLRSDDIQPTLLGIKEQFNKWMKITKRVQLNVIEKQR